MATSGNTSIMSTEVTVASKVAFGQICELFERMRKVKNNATRRKEFTKFVNKWKEIHSTLHKNAKSTDSFYQAFRLIVPQLERERPSYGIKETALAKLYVDVLGLSKNNPDAIKILQYKNPKSNNTAGDFAEIAYTHVFSKRCPNTGSMTIQQVNDTLDLIASQNNNGQKSLLKKTFLGLIQKTSSNEQKWIARILLKDTKLKIGQSALLEEFHPDSEQLFNATTSLRKVCEQLRDPSVRLEDSEVSLFQPFKPMLAAIANISEVEKLMDQKPFRIEIKYDGERSQLHRNGSEYKYFSRTGREYSNVFGSNPYSGSLTQFIHNSFASHVKTCILDGEMMGYDPELKTFVQKGLQFDIKHITEDSDLQPCFVAYDILLLNGELLSNLSLRERLVKLNTVFTPTEGRLLYAENWTCSKNADVIKHLNDAVDRREEGIIVKHPEGHYALNKRKGSGWIKIKPEYANGVVDDLDLVVVGGKFGSDKYANILTKFMLAIGVNEADGPPKKFKSFCMVGSGFTNRQLYQVMEILKPHLDIYRKKKPPPWLLVGKEKPEVIVEPKNSVVVQIKATEILTSNAYAAGCTLRFPRVVAHRDDKTFTDALDESQLNDLRSMAEGKLTARHASLTNEEPVAKRRKVQRHVVQPTISTRFQQANIDNVTKISASFKGKEFCVLTGSKEHTKKDLEKLVVSHEGTIVQNPSNETFCVIAKDELNVRVKNVIKSKKYDVVNINWFVRCLEAKRLLPFMPSELFYVTPYTEKEMAVIYDKFGDDFVTPLTVENLETIFKKIPLEKQESKKQIQSSINTLYQELEKYEFHNSESSLFHGKQFYIDNKLILNDFTTTNSSIKSREIEALLEFYCGIVCDEINDHTTHVIVFSTMDEIRLHEIFNLRRNRNRKFYVVMDKWITDCIDKCLLLDEKEYAVSMRSPQKFKR